MVSYMRPLFFELRASLITFRIFVRCQRLIARNVADGFLIFLLLTHFNAACSINDVSRGSLLCPKVTAMTMASAGPIQRENTPDGAI